MRALRTLQDGLLSALNGAARFLGGSDQSCAYPSLLSDEQIDWAFQASWLMRKIVVKPATEMTREGRDWQTDKGTIAKLEAEEKRLGLKTKLKKAEVLRGKGGGAVVLYVKGDDQTRPLDPSRIGLQGLTRINVWHKRRFQLGPPIEDWDDPWFGHPSFYRVVFSTTRGGVPQTFHPSRVVAFRGQDADDSNLAMAADRWWWGDSVVEIVKRAVDNVDMSENGFAKLIRRSAIRRLSVPFLYDKVKTADAEQAFTKRVAAIAQGENSDDITWLDGGDADGKGAETMADHQVSWQGIPDIKASYLAVAAAAADMPATVLLGKSPDGQNSTGASDQRIWEDTVKSRQDLELRPCLDQIDTALVPSALGKPDPDVWWKFAPLSTPTEAEEATTFKTTTDAIDKLDQTGLVPKIALEKSVQNLLEERGWLPGIGEALAEILEDERFPSLSEPDEEDPSALQSGNGVEGGGRQSAGGGSVPRPARRAANDARFTDGAAAKSLYIERKLLNADEIIRWAKAQGLETTLAPEDMHVTVAYSRQAVDWFAVGSDWSGDEKGNIRVKPGGPRAVERLGDGDAVALIFASDDLEWRHKRVREAGASWDWEDYRPHVTLTWNAPDVDVTKIAPYTGPLVFGPELFSEVREDWKSTTEEE